MNKKKLILLGVIAVLFLASIGFVIWQYHSSDSGKTAVIYQNGELLKEVDLEHVAEPFTFTVTSDGGGYNTIRVEEGKIGVTDTDCPDKICQNMGMISSTLYPVSCLPHRLVIQIRQDGAQPETLDSITR